MIKINLLENHFAPPAQHEKTDSDTSAGKTITIEAKKSQRRLLFIILIFVALVGGLTYGWVERYAVVAWLEQYTGPLHLLPEQDMETAAKAAEEARQEKIRNLYMYNTIRYQERYRRFLFRTDSIVSANSQKWHLTSLGVEESNYAFDVFSKTQKDLEDFTVLFLESKSIDETKPQAIKPTSLVKGLGFKRTMSGTLKTVSTPSDSEIVALKIIYLDLEKAKQKILDGARNAGLKILQDGKMTSSKGVVMSTHSGELKLEGSVSDYFKYMAKLNEMRFNFEIGEIDIQYADYSARRKADKKKPVPDTIFMKYSILLPRQSESADSTKTK